MFTNIVKCHIHIRMEIDTLSDPWVSELEIEQQNRKRPKIEQQED
jgi:hypothetical protein